MVYTGAGVVIEELISHGIDTIFGYPGGNVIDIYDELYKNADRIKHILTADEQGAAHAADAYARVTGKTSAVIATSGPGATNLVTGIANAYLDSVPVVFITGNVPITMLGRDSFQEIDILGLTLPIVKHSYVVKDINELRQTLREAFKISGSGRKGPVLVDIPKNIQTESYDYESEYNVTLQKPPHLQYFTGIPATALDLIKQSSRPYIYCGGGVCVTNTGDCVIELSKRLDAPIGMSLMGLGAIPYSYDLNLGMSGMQGRYAANIAQSEADLLIALGVRFSDRAICNMLGYENKASIIHIDIDMAEIGKNIKPDISICGDLEQVLPMLISQVDNNRNGEWMNRIHDLKKVGSVPVGDGFTPRNIIGCVNDLYDDETIITTDVGQHQMWVAQYYRFEKPRKLVTSGGLGAMGFGFGAAIGASIASSGGRVVLFTSDGSFGMNLIELATAVTYNLPITIIVLNNGVLGMVRQMQTQDYNGRYSQTTLNRATDFSAVARAFGADGYSVDNLDDLRRILSDCSSIGPTLVDCKIDMDEKVLPLIPIDGDVNDMVLY